MQLAEVAEEYEDKLEAETGQQPLMIADGKYRLASVLAFYRSRFQSNFEHVDEGIAFTTSQWILPGKGLSYPYWISRKDWIGRDAIYITDDEVFLHEVRPWFEQVESVVDARLKADGHYNLVICRGLLDEPRNVAVDDEQ